MSRKKRRNAESGDENDLLKTIVFITAILELIDNILDLIDRM